MSLFDKILDVYYDITFRLEDLVNTVKYKAEDLVDSVKGNKKKFEVEFEESFAKPAKKRKKTSKKKKK